MKVYIIHGWEGHPNNCWFPWLKKELEKLGYEVIIPQMPNPEIPIMKDWIKKLQSLIKLDKDTILIGHSIGCQTILRYLETIDIKIKACYFVAGWLTLDLHLDTEEAKIVAKPWLETPIDFKKIKSNCKSFTTFLSTNDKWVNCKENKLLFEKNINSKVIIEKDKDHYDKIKQIPSLINEIHSKTI